MVIRGFCYTTTAIFKRFKPSVALTFLIQPKVRERVDLLNLQIASFLATLRDLKRESQDKLQGLHAWGFKIGQHKVPSNAKIGSVKIVWSRELPATPSSVTIIKDCRGIYANRPY
uniref:hypothetical protein n=1 Tax=Okeania sp. SIO2F4 TaxID=2607790 RepID=UPI0025D25512|nr:hypothetical protein [Okeania sp. SIO2F4]